MFKKVLIANRGEIALRVIRACKELGLATVAVHSTADAESLHVRFADEAICIGPPPSKQSYLNVRALLSAADVTGADAIHPGYGFLSENAEFAEMVTRMGLKFIGPRPEMIRLMGNKVAAREAMEKAGLPLLPGARGKLADADEAERIAEEVGFPVILKAAAGGGGRGMKICRDRAQVRQMFETASNEALAAFGDGSMYLERYVEQPRHIELQIVADEHGNIIHLGERECSVQRRHQKLIEEAPSPGGHARAAARDGRGRARGHAEDRLQQRRARSSSSWTRTGRYYFMEMNTRIQVEHPVTEQVYRLDLVREQIRLAAGEPLERTQETVVPGAHSIECRVNAEDPVTFAPVARQDHGLPPARRLRRARRHDGVRAVQGAALLRLARREARHHRGDPRDRAEARDAGAERVRDRGDQDQHPLPQARARAPRVRRPASTTRGSSTRS